MSVITLDALRELTEQLELEITRLIDAFERKTSAQLIGIDLGEHVINADGRRARTEWVRVKVRL